MKLSIVVPVYNGEKLIEQMADSLLRQSLSDWELILVDDGSTDSSSMICDKLSEKYTNIKTVHKPNGGVSSARNTGIDVAEGEYIGFVDADDAVKPYMYEKMIASAEKYNSQFVMGGYEKVIDEANRQYISLPFDEILEGENEVRTVAWSMAFWNGHLNGKRLSTIYGSVWPNLYSADILKQYQIRFPEGIAIGEDLLFNLEYLSYIKKISVLNEPLYEYNVANTSATRKQNKYLWQRYCTLLNHEEKLLTALYGESDELCYNIHMQHINYAINVAEEQICVFLEGKEMKKELRELCSDKALQYSASYIIANGKTTKERLQAFLIRKKYAGLIKVWLTRRIL